MKHILHIELLDADEAAEAALAAALHREGFTSTIAGRDGTRFHLPKGEWAFDGKATVHDVLDMAKRAAASTGKGHRAIATEVGNQVWSGLDPA